MATCPHFDHLALSELENPYDEIRELIEKCPVGYSEEHDGFWVLNKYKDVSAAARDPLLYSSQLRGSSIPNHGFPVTMPPIESDPPQHTQYRGPLLHRFTPRAVRAYEDETRAYINELIDGFIERGESDLATELTYPLPTRIATKFLGMPVDDGPRLQQLASSLLEGNGDVDVIEEVVDYLVAFYENTIANPGDGIPSIIASLEVDGQTIGEDQFIFVMTVIFMAGLDTTANAGAHILLYLARNVELRDTLIKDPAQIPVAVEELLRYLSPLPLLARTTTEDVEIEGEKIPKGERVGVHWMAANHDPDEFPEPDSFILGRTPNRHLAFGVGPHRCLGANLARMELAVLIEVVLARMPDYRIIDEKVSHYRGTVRGIDRLPAVFTPGKRMR